MGGFCLGDFVLGGDFVLEPIPTENVLSFQNNLNEHVISLERGDFKLSIGSLNN